MARQKGSKKYGGREQGTPNLLTKELRERISDFLNDNWKQVETDFKVLEPEKRVLLFEKLLQYSVPRLQATELTTPVKPEVQLTDEERKARIAELKKQLFEDE